MTGEIEESEKNQKAISKQLQKEKRKVYKLEGNVNRILKSVEVPSTFEFSKKELHNDIVRGAGTKNALYNGKFKRGLYYGVTVSLEFSEK